MRFPSTKPIVNHTLQPRLTVRQAPGMHDTCLGLFLCNERKEHIMSDRRRRSPCPRATRIPTETICPIPLFPEEELLRLATPSPAAKREQLVREAIAPYLSLTELRRL